MWSRKKTMFCRSFHRPCTKCEPKNLQKVFADKMVSLYCANSLEGVRLCWTLSPREGLSVDAEQYNHKSAVISPYWTLLPHRFWLSEHHSHKGACFHIGSGCQNTTPTKVLSWVCWAPFPLMWCHQCVLHTTPTEVLRVHLHRTPFFQKCWCLSVCAEHHLYGCVVIFVLFPVAALFNSLNIVLAMDLFNFNPYASVPN